MTALFETIEYAKKDGAHWVTIDGDHVLIGGNSGSSSGSGSGGALPSALTKDSSAEDRAKVRARMAAQKMPEDAKAWTSGPQTLVGTRHGSAEGEIGAGTFHSLYDTGEHSGREKSVREIEFKNLLTVPHEDALAYGGGVAQSVLVKWHPELKDNAAFHAAYKAEAAGLGAKSPNEFIDVKVAREAVKRGYDGIRYGNLEFQDLRGLAKSSVKMTVFEPVEFKGAGHWVTIDGHHVLIGGAGAAISHEDVKAAVGKLGLSTRTQSALAKAHDDGHITTDTHLYGVIGHAKKLQANGLNEKTAYATALQLHKASGGTSSMAAVGAHGVSEMKVSDLATDPERFQYKVNVGAKGTNAELGGVQKWNPNLAGVQLVWKDHENGQTYIINGHHRHELASRLGVDTVAVRHIEAKNAAEARYVGAVANIAEGRGTAIDAGKLLRDHNVTPEKLAEDGVSLKGKVASDGMALSKLPEHLWGKVYRGEMSVSRGVAIGGSGLSAQEQHLLHQSVEGAEKRGKRLTDHEVGELAGHIKAAGETSVHTSSLFGEEEVKQNLFVEKAQLSSYLKQKLAHDKKLFGFVAKGGRAADLEKAGNKINVSESQKIAEQSAHMEDLFNRLAHRSGPVADALHAASAKLAQGESGEHVRSELYTRVRDAIHQTLAGGHGEGAHADSGHDGERDTHTGSIFTALPLERDGAIGFSDADAGAGGAGKRTGVPAAGGGRAMSDVVTRDVQLFQAANYPDKGVNVSIDDLKTIAKNTGRVPIQVGHTEPEFKLGEAHGLYVKDDWLWGKFDLHPAADVLLNHNGLKTVSVGMNPAKTHLLEVSATASPRVVGARMFSGEQCIAFSLGETAPAGKEGKTMPEDVKDAITPAQFSALETRMNEERTARLAAERRMRETEARQIVRDLGQVPPAAAEFAVRLLASEQPITFSENGADVEKPVAALFSGFLDNLPKDAKTGKIVFFGAPVAGNLPADKTDDADASARERLNALATERAEKDKVGFAVAFNSVCKENKELALQYRSEVAGGAN